MLGETNSVLRETDTNDDCIGPVMRDHFTKDDNTIDRRSTNNDSCNIVNPSLDGMALKVLNTYDQWCGYADARDYTADDYLTTNDEADLTHATEHDGRRTGTDHTDDEHLHNDDSNNGDDTTTTTTTMTTTMVMVQTEREHDSPVTTRR